MTPEEGLHYSLLENPVIGYRTLDGKAKHVSLPQLLIVLAEDSVRDFPALRPHQRHPWHAFLVQLAALALAHTASTRPLETEEEWRAALLALTPSDPDGAAWCLVSPPERPALLQAPVADGRIDGWKSVHRTPDELDMLVTSKNHDLKGARMRRCAAEDWLFALVSLQTQEGFMGQQNYGISRMNGGFASRAGIGVAGEGGWGARWRRDLMTSLATRAHTAETRGLDAQTGIALLWLMPWDGNSSLTFNSLDPHYIEICRRIRLRTNENGLHAIGTGTKAPRVSAKELNGVTGDLWTPVDIAAAKALTIAGEGFHYKLLAELLFGSKFLPGAAQDIGQGWPEERLSLIAQGIARGQGKTERYHERRVPISPKTRALILGGQQTTLARIAGEHITAIAELRDLLWTALSILFNNGKAVMASNNSAKDKATRFAGPFEQAENLRFFDDLSAEIEANAPDVQRLAWLLGLVERAEAVLRSVFDAGPRSSIQRYRAQSAALSYFHGTLRSAKFSITELTNHYRQRTNTSTGGDIERT